MVLRNSRAGKRASDRPRREGPAPRRDRALEMAIAGDAIAIRFQPQFDVTSGRIVGVEALARWRGVASAEALFTRAARAGLSERLSRHVQAKALRMAGQWKGALADLRLSINLLPEDVVRAGFEDWLLAECAETGFAPGKLTAEITESGLVADREGASARLERLRAAGVAIAVDDFGTGYASLAYLTSLPLDALKIDRGLIAYLVGGRKDRIVVRAMVRLAQELGLRVVVEGVETRAQLTLIAGWGCEVYQGFLGAAAMDEDELTAFVGERAKAAA